MRATKKDTRIFSATKDYYGPSGAGNISVDKVALHITGRKKIVLNDELRSDIFAIRENMKDDFYMNQLILK